MKLTRKNIIGFIIVILGLVGLLNGSVLAIKSLIFGIHPDGTEEERRVSLIYLEELRWHGFVNISLGLVTVTFGSLVFTIRPK